MSKLTRLDRIIGWVSPMRGARRAQARLAMQTLGYEGARSGRRTDGWITPSNSADAESSSVMATLRDRARDLVRNNAYAARAIDVKGSNTIGVGITAEVKNRKLAKRWDTFVETCDADGRLDFYGMQSLIERCRMESGECLIRRVPSQMVNGGIAMKLRVLEPDYIDHGRDGTVPENGNQIRGGIEYDAFGVVVAYWLHRNHPGDSWATPGYVRGNTSVRVDADEIIHVFRKLRAGQTRGVTDFAPVMLRMRDLDDYDDAEVMRKKIEACFAAFITSPASLDATALGTLSTDDIGRVESLYPGMLKYLRQGEGVTMADPKTSGGYADFQRFGLRAIAAGTGIPYELMTGDLSQVNYSSYRAGLVDFRRRIEQDQWHIYVPQVCGRVASWFMEEAARIAPGLGDRTAFEWTPPRFELIDPLKETEAEIAAIEAGLDTWDELVRRRGWPAEEQRQKIARNNAEADRLGIKLRGDYRLELAAKATPAAPPKKNNDPNANDAEAA